MGRLLLRLRAFVVLDAAWRWLPDEGLPQPHPHEVARNDVDACDGCGTESDHRELTTNHEGFALCLLCLDEAEETERLIRWKR